MAADDKALTKEQKSLEQGDTSAVDKGKAALAEAKSHKKRFDGTHAGYMLKRVSEGNGNVLAGGIAYYAMTSLTAVVVIAVTLSTYVALVNQKWHDALFDYIGDTIPGIIKSEDDPNGLVDPSTIQPETVTGIVGVISILILINTSTRYLSGLRVGSRTMLGQGAGSPVKGKLRDFAALLALVILVVLGMVMQLLASQFSSVVANFFADETVSEWIVRLPAIAVGVVIDMGFVALAIVVLGRYIGPRLPLFWTLLVAAVGIGILRQGVSWVVGSAADSPVLGSAAAIMTVLIFANYIARIVLYAGAWLGTQHLRAEAKKEASASLRESDVIVVEMEPVARRRFKSITTARAARRKS